MRTVWVTALWLSAAVALVPAQRAGTPGPAASARGAARAPTKMVTTVECAASLGTGVKSRRGFCDVIVAATPAESVSMTIPPHAGTSTLQFDLHNRFTVPGASVPAVLAFARHRALVSVIRESGARIGQAVVAREFRTPADLFDQITGGSRPGGVKAVAPGPPESVRFTIPAGVSKVGIVGAMLEVRTRAGGAETFDTPGRPVAIVSNLRLDYTPAR
ncbi:MAG: hypothetical protein ABI051_18335 [Vicinamibacterales bacterium]